MTKGEIDGFFNKMISDICSGIGIPQETMEAHITFTPCANLKAHNADKFDIMTKQGYKYDLLTETYSSERVAK